MLVKRAIALMVILFAFQAFASSLDKSEKVERAIVEEARKSQQTVSTSSDKAIELRAEIDVLRAEIDGLEVYQKHLKKLLLSQKQELNSLTRQLEEIAHTRQSIVPMMYQMLDALEEYIREDIPLRKEARTERLKSLQNLMGRADVSDAEKYRRILEAYQIELDYVNRLGVYTGPIETGGLVREVEQLNLGHISFVARSLDKQHYWVWNRAEKSWNALEKQHFNRLDKAFLVASKLAPPSLLELPLSVKEVSHESK